MLAGGRAGPMLCMSDLQATLVTCNEEAAGAKVKHAGWGVCGGDARPCWHPCQHQRCHRRTPWPTKQVGGAYKDCALRHGQASISISCQQRCACAAAAACLELQLLLQPQQDYSIDKLVRPASHRHAPQAGAACLSLLVILGALSRAVSLPCCELTRQDYLSVSSRAMNAWATAGQRFLSAALRSTHALPLIRCCFL